MTVLCTVIWNIKPECADDFVQLLGGMFSETKTHDGFVSIRLQQGEISKTEFILIQEWETAQHHQDYARYRFESGDVDRLTAMAAVPPMVHYWSQNILASA